MIRFNTAKYEQMNTLKNIQTNEHIKKHRNLWTHKETGTYEQKKKQELMNTKRNRRKYEHIKKHANIKKHRTYELMNLWRNIGRNKHTKKWTHKETVKIWTHRETKENMNT